MERLKWYMAGKELFGGDLRGTEYSGASPRVIVSEAGVPAMFREELCQK